MSTIGVGIIGTGSIANSCHGPVVNAVKDTSLVAVLSRDESKGKEFLIKCGEGNSTTHTSLDSFLRDPNIAVVIICSPDRLHAEQALACLKAGKHVLIEKPMATNGEDAQELVKLADAKNLTLAVGFHLRSHNGHRELYSRVVEKKEIGELRHIRAVWAFPLPDDSNWRAKSDLGKWWSLAAVGAHCIDLTRWFGDDMNDWKQFAPVISTDLYNGPHDETAVIAGQLSSGTTVEIVSTIKFGPYQRVELFGSEGIALCENTLGRVGGGEVTINNNRVEFEPVVPFINQLEDIVESIRTGNKPRANGLIGLRSVKDLLLAHDN